MARDDRIDGLAITYVEKSFLSSVTSQKKPSRKGARDTKAITEPEANRDEEDLWSDGEGQEISEEDKGKKRRQVQNIDPELQILTRCHIMEACLVAEDN